MPAGRVETAAMNLLKFDGPFQVQKEQRKAKDDPFFFCKSTNIATLGWNPDPNAIALCKDTESPNREVEEVLNTIVTPMIWEEDGKTWRQVVSREPASRANIIYLHRELDHRLVVRQARKEGICPIRRELYAQAFDELIRQVTTGCPERGILLLRVRDEMKMTLSAYQALNDASSAYGIVKRQGADQQRKLDRNFKKMNEEKIQLTEEYQALEQELEIVHRTYDEQRTADDKRHAEDIQFQKRVHQLLRKKLEGLLKAKAELN